MKIKNIKPMDEESILIGLLRSVEEVDFTKEIFVSSLDEENEENENTSSTNLLTVNKEIPLIKPTEKHFITISIEKLISLANKKQWNLCRRNGDIYVYNGCYWLQLSKDRFEPFLGQAANKMGVPKVDASFYAFKEKLLKQFKSAAQMMNVDASEQGVLINLRNGTFEVTPNNQKLNAFNSDDFLTYQLDFEFDADAKCPNFLNFLNRVVPQIDKQKVLAEYVAYVFIKSAYIKLEKVLLLYGTGANGKSVFFEIVTALLGKENVSNYSLQNLTDKTGYYRAALGNKLLNYGSEIKNLDQSDIFKSLASGEPVSARLPYKDPFELKDYAKFIFNANELPKNTEQTEGFFRRFLIIPFEETIPVEEQDPELANKIISGELSGVFNWVLDGLERLLHQKKFSDCEAAQYVLKRYRIESDSVQLFLEDQELTKHATEITLLKNLYSNYREYCVENGYKPNTKTAFNKRLKNLGFLVERKSQGNVVFIGYKQKSV